MIIAVDFDGTCVEHEFPDVGRDVPGAAEWLQKFVGAGAQLILWTMRSNDPTESRGPLTDALEWFAERQIPLWGVNVNPEQSSWTSSRKAYAHVYVDDAAFGCPLVERYRGRPFVDWNAVGPAVLAMIEADKARRASLAPKGPTL